MRKSEIKLLIIEILLICFFVLNIFLFKLNNLYIISLILSLFLLITIWLLGFEKNRQANKKKAIIVIILFLLIFAIVYLSISLISVWSHNPYKITPLGILKNIFPVVLLIISSELLRYAINRKGDKNKFILIMSAITFIIIDISLQIRLYDMSVGGDVIDFVALLLYPSISKNIFLTYCTYKYGYQPCMLYRMIMEIPVYCIPILPNISPYVTAILNLVFPMILLFGMVKILNNKLKKNDANVDIRKKHYVSKGIITLLVILALISFILRSDLFPYQAITIGSGSMQPNLNIGDVVIVEKLNKDEMNTLKEKDILVFKYGDKIVIHRIVEVIENNNVYSFKTKGDNNEDVDNWTVLEKDVIGKTSFRIKYIGYPTVWLYENIGR